MRAQPWIVACTLLVAGCSSEPSTSAGPGWGQHDGGSPDASKPDAALDATHDAPAESTSDAVHDAGEHETGSDALDASDAPDLPDWIVDGVATCPELGAFRDVPTDCSAVLQACIDRTPVSMNLDLEPGRYSLAAQIKVDRSIGLRTRNRFGTPSCTADAAHGCAELFTMPEFSGEFGVLVVSAPATIDHMVVNGNRQNRGGTLSAAKCQATPIQNSFGFNAMLQCSGCTLQDSVSMNALCGTGFLVNTPATNITVVRNTFAFNGVHNVNQLWSDGLTVLDADHSQFVGNRFVNNSDVDFIFGGCPGCTIKKNTIEHTAEPSGGSFAALMIQKWPGTSGNYDGVDVSENSIDCGPNRDCGSGLYIGSESWYPETPYGKKGGGTSGLITGNSIVHAKNALYIAAEGLNIYGNGFLEAHGVQIPNSCHKNLVSVTPIVVSPTAKSCHFNFENDPAVNPTMAVHYSSSSAWIGCVPNYPF
jgi:hypothetical protein